MMPRLSISSRFALRNLSRNVRRTLISVGGVVIGCAIALANISIQLGKIDMFVRNVAEGGTGHLRAVPREWSVSHDPGLRLGDWRNELARLRAMPDVRVATPRARLQGMLAVGTRLAGVEIVGVDPESEPASDRFVRKLEAGRYLTGRDSHKMVLGRWLADRLRIGVGDSVVVTVVDRSGAVKSDLFDVLGIVNLGSRQIESGICQVTLADLEALSGLAGAGEIAVILKHPDDVDAFVESLKPTLPAADTALSWEELAPEVRAGVVINRANSRILGFVFMCVALLGIASAQLTAVLERRRELAVLAAIGMGRMRILGLMFSEALALGTLSFAVTVLLEGPVLLYFARVGFRVLSQSMVVAGTIVDPIFYTDFGAWFFADAALLCYLATFLASVYPAVFATRLDPAEALRVAQ